MAPSPPPPPRGAAAGRPLRLGRPAGAASPTEPAAEGERAALLGMTVFLGSEALVFATPFTVYLALW